MAAQPEYSFGWLTPEDFKLQKLRRDVFNSYVWVELNEIGGGAQARVTRMRCASDQRLQCAKKNMVVIDDQDAEHIKKECNILTMIKHPNILEYYDYKIDIENQRAYIYMELLMKVSSLMIYLELTKKS